MRTTTTRATTPAALAAHLQAVVDRLASLPDEPFPAGSVFITIGMHLHRRDGDGYTNRALMAYIDTVAATLGLVAPQVWDGRYATRSEYLPVRTDVTGYLNTGKPVVDINPDL